MSLPKKLTKIPIPRDIHILEGFPKRYPAENLGMVGTQIFVVGMLTLKPQSMFQLGDCFVLFF